MTTREIVLLSLVAILGSVTAYYFLFFVPTTERTALLNDEVSRIEQQIELARIRQAQYNFVQEQVLELQEQLYEKSELLAVSHENWERITAGIPIGFADTYNLRTLQRIVVPHGVLDSIIIHYEPAFPWPVNAMYDTELVLQDAMLGEAGGTIYLTMITEELPARPNDREDDDEYEYQDDGLTLHERLLAELSRNFHAPITSYTVDGTNFNVSINYEAWPIMITSAVVTVTTSTSGWTQILADLHADPAISRVVAYSVDPRFIGEIFELEFDRLNGRVTMEIEFMTLRP